MKSFSNILGIFAKYPEFAGWLYPAKRDIVNGWFYDKNQNKVVNCDVTINAIWNRHIFWCWWTEPWS